MSQVDYYLSIYSVCVCVVGGVVMFLGCVLCCILFLPLNLHDMSLYHFSGFDLDKACMVNRLCTWNY